MKKNCPENCPQPGFSSFNHRRLRKYCLRYRYVVKKYIFSFTSLRKHILNRFNSKMNNSTSQYHIMHLGPSSSLQLRQWAITNRNVYGSWGDEACSTDLLEISPVLPHMTGQWIIILHKFSSFQHQLCRRKMFRSLSTRKRVKKYLFPALTSGFFRSRKSRQERTIQRCHEMYCHLWHLHNILVVSLSYLAISSKSLCYYRDYTNFAFQSFSMSWEGSITLLGTSYSYML